MSHNSLRVKVFLSFFKMFIKERVENNSISPDALHFSTSAFLCWLFLLFHPLWHCVWLVAVINKELLTCLNISLRINTQSMVTTNHHYLSMNSPYVKLSFYTKHEMVYFHAFVSRYLPLHSNQVCLNDLRTSFWYPSDVHQAHTIISKQPQLSIKPKFRFQMYNRIE